MDSKNLAQNDGSAFYGFDRGLVGHTSEVEEGHASDCSRLTAALTVNIIDTYQKCSKDFLPMTKKQHRILTQPSKAVGNDGMDNEESNLICRVYDKLASDKGQTSYTILENLQ